MPFALVPFLLLIVPIIEIGAFIVIGGQIGIALTLLMILVTAIIGTFLLRIQGLGLLNEIQQQTEAGQIPGRALGHGVLILVAGILLLTPGFVTDGLGFLLFVPQVRDLIWKLVASRISVSVAGQTFSTQAEPREDMGWPDQDDTVIDLGEDEYRRSEPNKDSPWNKNG